MTARLVRTALAACLLLLPLGSQLAAPGRARADITMTFFGTADSVGTLVSNNYITLQPKRVPAGDNVQMEFTNNGKLIVNKDGSHFGYQGTNTANGPADTEKTYVTYQGKSVREFNGLAITDIRTTIGGKLSSNTSGGFFNPGGGNMPNVATALAGLGITNGSLAYPTFSSDLGQETPPPLYVGVALQDWASKGIAIDPGTIGSLYQVTNGMATALLSGSGPAPSALTGFFFGSSPLDAGSTSFTGSPFTGEVVLSTILDVGLAPAVPEPSSLALLGTGLAAALAIRARRATRRPVVA